MQAVDGGVPGLERMLGYIFLAKRTSRESVAQEFEIVALGAFPASMARTMMVQMEQLLELLWLKTRYDGHPRRCHGMLDFRKSAKTLY